MTIEHIEQAMLNGASSIYGTYSIYGLAQRGKISVRACDVSIDLQEDSNGWMLRRSRQKAKQARRTPRPLSDNCLKKEMLIVLGPDVSAKKAVQRLRELADHIERAGMFIGSSTSGVSYFERTKTSRGVTYVQL